MSRMPYVVIPQYDGSLYYRIRSRRAGRWVRSTRAQRGRYDFLDEAAAVRVAAELTKRQGGPRAAR